MRENYYWKENFQMEKGLEKEKCMMLLIVNYYLKVYIQMIKNRLEQNMKKGNIIYKLNNNKIGTGIGIGNRNEKEYYENGINI